MSEPRATTEVEAGMAIKRRETTRGPRYDVQWRLPDRSKGKKTFRTEREARRFEAKLIGSGALGEVIDPRGGKIPLADVYRSWLASRPDLSAKVRRGMKTTGGFGLSRGLVIGRSGGSITTQFSSGSTRCPRLGSVPGRFAGRTRSSR
jgi:hypothetical protein